MDNEVLYKSKTQQKRDARILEQQEFLTKKKMAEIEKRWEDSQIKAASAQSVLNYMVELFNNNKGELNEQQIRETEEQIEARQREIQEFLMESKEIYTKEMAEFDVTISPIEGNK